MATKTIEANPDLAKEWTAKQESPQYGQALSVFFDDYDSTVKEANEATGEEGRRLGMSVCFKVTEFYAKHVQDVLPDYVNARILPAELKSEETVSILREYKADSMADICAREL